MSELLSENFQFLVVKFSIYFNMRVFVMIYLENMTSHMTEFNAVDQKVFHRKKGSYYLYKVADLLV